MPNTATAADDARRTSLLRPADTKARNARTTATAIVFAAGGDNAIMPTAAPRISGRIAGTALGLTPPIGHRTRTATIRNSSVNARRNGCASRPAEPAATQAAISPARTATTAAERSVEQRGRAPFAGSTCLSSQPATCALWRKPPQKAIGNGGGQPRRVRSAYGGGFGFQPTQERSPVFFRPYGALR